MNTKDIHLSFNERGNMHVQVNMDFGMSLPDGVFTSTRDIHDAIMEIIEREIDKYVYKKIFAPDEVDEKDDGTKNKPKYTIIHKENPTGETYHENTDKPHDEDLYIEQPGEKIYSSLSGPSFHGESWYTCPVCQKSFEFYDMQFERGFKKTDKGHYRHNCGAILK